MIDLAAEFPDWVTDVEVQSSGRDANGNPVGGPPKTISDALVAPRATDEPLDRTDLTATTAVLYDTAPEVVILSTSRIVVPAGHRMAGTWAVDGDPGPWPLGRETPLRRL